MKTLKLYKADSLTIEEVPNRRIQIDSDLPAYVSLEKTEKCFELQALYLEDALYNSLPQAVYDRLIIHMMKRKVSSYKGLICNTK